MNLVNESLLEFERSTTLRNASGIGMMAKIDSEMIEDGRNDFDNNIDYKLIWSAYKGNLNYIKFLISRGADIHVHNDYPLRESVNYKRMEIIKYLLSKGAYPYKALQTAIDEANGLNNGNFSVVELLIKQIIDDNGELSYGILQQLPKKILKKFNYL